MTDALHGRADDGAMAALPRVLTDTGALAASAGAPDERGAVWRLTEPTRHLDANVIALRPRYRHFAFARSSGSAGVASSTWQTV